MRHPFRHIVWPTYGAEKDVESIADLPREMWADAKLALESGPPSNRVYGGIVSLGGRGEMHVLRYVHERLQIDCLFDDELQVVIPISVEEWLDPDDDR